MQELYAKNKSHKIESKWNVIAVGFDGFKYSEGTKTAIHLYANYLFHLYGLSKYVEMFKLVSRGKFHYGTFEIENHEESDHMVVE